VKQALCAFLLFLASVPAFSQAGRDALVYVLEVRGGTAGERRYFEDNLGREIPPGYALTRNILLADYALSSYIMDSQDKAGHLLVCSLLDAKQERELVSISLLYTAPEETLPMLPYMLWSLFSNAPLEWRDPKLAIVEIKGEAPVQGGENADLAPEYAEAPEAWKNPRLFFNARAGLSVRFYIGEDSIPTTSILTFEGGLESEIRLLDFFALQLGLNFALDQVEYQHPPPTPDPFVYSTSIMSIPLMAKFFLHPSTRTILGLYLGSYWTVPLLGMTEPPPFGFLGGLDLAVKTRLGVLFLDLRYSMDLGRTGIMDSPISYHRMFASICGGYKIGIVKRQTRP
jgi:hypothetical protein